LTDTAGKYSFSRRRRLDGPHAYAAVFAFKCWVTGETFRVYAKPNGITAARLGIVTSKKISRRAVERNYGKRLAREVFRVEGLALQGLDFVVRPLAPVTTTMAAAARIELRGLLHRAHRQCQGRTEKCASTAPTDNKPV